MSNLSFEQRKMYRGDATLWQNEAASEHTQYVAFAKYQTYPTTQEWQIPSVIARQIHHQEAAALCASFARRSLYALLGLSEEG